MVIVIFIYRLFKRSAPWPGSLGFFIVAALLTGEACGQLRSAMGDKSLLDNQAPTVQDNWTGFDNAAGNSATLVEMARAVTGGKGNRISSDYLGYTLEKKHGYAVHHGIDFEAPVGAPVYALKSGVVVAKIYGNAAESVVIVRDPSTGFIWSYGHINHIAIEKGQKIHAGQRLGTILDPAAAGETWPPHVHISTMRVMPGSPAPIGWGRAYGSSEQQAIDNAKRYTVNPAQAYAM